MSRADEITSEVRKLVLTLKAMEAQLQESMPKRTHEEIVAKMQGQMDDVQRQLAITKEELDRTTSVGARLSALEARLSTLYDVAAAQNEAIKGLADKLAQGTVPYAMHAENQTRIQQLEEQVYSMVPRGDFDALQTQLAATVPRERLEDVEKALADAVPKERLAQAEAKIAELEAAMADTVPRATLEELKERIATLMKEAPAVQADAAPQGQ